MWKILEAKGSMLFLEEFSLVHLAGAECPPCLSPPNSRQYWGLKDCRVAFLARTSQCVFGVEWAFMQTSRPI